ncbi:unnamed protein product [Schistosoma margrebowiei]|uniref:Uncharacterized protein n=1 Tax=Schistosoma margrebowiei TaxID=48269 RepID=A0A3P8AB07_9TREM|nr:unnamed protein product [Schistosoma margrebowiei]
MTTTVRSSNSSINEATFSKSFSLNPRVVSAGVPILKPDGCCALESPTTVFLFRTIPTRSPII